MRKVQRLRLVLVLLAAVAVAVALAGYALRDTVSLFFTPSEALALRQAADIRVAAERRFRLGGLVAEGSVLPRGDDLAVRFVVTDRAADVPVVYRGILPDLFREGQGVIVTGLWADDGVFVADTLLARHDENYMPPEVAAGLGKISAEDLERLERARRTPRGAGGEGL